MRVITGLAKGRRLETLKGDDVRPTTDRIKEAIFSIVQFSLPGRSFLDLFSGSGQMGIEALSRGAKECVFVDFNKESIEVIKRNLKNTKLEENAKVINTDYNSFLDRTIEKFDIVFLDPPYRDGILQNALQKTTKIMNKSGMIICENPQNEELEEEINDFRLDRMYHYGKIKISIYCHKDVIE